MVRKALFPNRQPAPASHHFGICEPLDALFVQLLELAARVTGLRFLQQNHVSARHALLRIPGLADAEVP